MKKLVLWMLLILGLLFTGCNGKSSTTTETKTVTLAVFEYESQLSGTKLQEWVNLYNQSHTDIKIEIVNYLDNYADPMEALNQIKIEISAGKGPDMVDFGRQYSPLDASNGMMVNLYPFMEDDDSFEKLYFYHNILESFEVGDSLYVLVPSYRIDSYATANQELLELERMDIEQLVDAYNKLGDESILFPGETKKAVFGMICYGSLENYVDWDEGKCYFNSDSFKEILHFSNQFSTSLNMAEDYSAKAIFTEGRALLYPVSIDSVYGTTSVRMLYGQTPTYIGYPIDSGNGNMAAIADIAIGITSTSQYKEEAWEFLSSLLDSDFQDNMRGLPLRVSSLEKNFKDAMTEELDSNGQKVVKDQLIFEGEAPVNIYEISKEDAEVLQEIISKIECSATVDSNLYNIVLEESEFLFYDDRNVNDVADIIQNRASVYINEKK
ncbi:MAG: extracellular solute-binding protein [Eubacteriales bacterium]